LLVETPQNAFAFRFRKLILATGAREIFLPFPGWTLPGVMGVGGLQAMVKSGLPIRGKTVVIAGSGPLLLAAAAYLRKCGAHVPLIAEQARRNAVARFALQLIGKPGKILQTAGLRLDLIGARYLQDCWVERAEGNGRLESVQLRHGAHTWTQACDYAGIAYGLCPNVELACLLGCKIEQGAVSVNEFQETSVDGIFCAGECTGIGGLDLALIEGEIAGYAALGKAEKARTLFSKRASALRFSEALDRAFMLRRNLKELPRADTIVCRCEDVCFQQLQSLDSFRAAKLYTRCGMGPCQARICGPATHFLFGWAAESIRPPIFPARLDSLTFEPSIRQEALPPQ
jgi:NADPH-dependent 2,4-dienoyl-CoA reductase/sulfur reductase-like enzyme